MLSKIRSCGLMGIDGYIVEVETDIGNGIPGFEIVGLADVAVKESKERVKAAIRNSSFDFPVRRITVNLAPASKKKEGSSFDRSGITRGPTGLKQDTFQRQDTVLPLRQKEAT